jgi:hypothetical protein
VDPYQQAAVSSVSFPAGVASQSVDHHERLVDASHAKYVQLLYDELSG